MITIEEFVSREVLYNVTSLVSDAVGTSMFDMEDDEHRPLFRPEANSDQKYECVTGEGFYIGTSGEEGEKVWYWGDLSSEAIALISPQSTLHDSHEEAVAHCIKTNNLDTDEYVGEPMQHLLVTERMARDLKAHGEAVAIDWHGMDIWGRQTLGQSIHFDSVIVEIYEGLTKS